jgi:hypothetical protein
VRRILGLILSLGWGLQGYGTTIVLPEDEFILPPLLNRIENHPRPSPEGLNVIGSGRKSRRAVPGEWFDYGDRLDLPANLAFQVIQSEGAAWVGGGVFQGRVGAESKVENSGVRYALVVERGWVRVWIRASKAREEFQVSANGDLLTAKEADFWLNARTGATDLYVIRGEVSSRMTAQSYSAGGFVTLPAGAKKPSRFSEEWNPKAIQVSIAGSYPGLIKLADRTEEDWESGRLSEVYAGFRKRGWRKAYRFTPIPAK